MVAKLKNYTVFISLLFILLFIVLGCQHTHIKEDQVVGKAQAEKPRDLRKILKNNQLIVLAENTATTYFIYRGQKMGFEYEILKAFAQEIGVKLKIKTIDNLDDIIAHLKNGEGDIIACNYTITNERKKKIDFSVPILRTSQVLIQRKPEDWRKMRRREWKNKIIQDPIQLSRKTVHVWLKSSYYNRLINLQHELGDTINIEPLNGDIIAEEAIEMVSKGLINYTVVDQNVAAINKRFFPNIDASLKLSVRQRIAFGLRKRSPLLRKRLNAWLKEFKKTSRYKYIKHKYFSSYSSISKAKSNFSSIKGERISRFDPIVKRYSKRYGWDWRLVSALIYQESKFKLNQESWAGAYGLMQFMPGTGPTFGVYPDSPPAVQIRGGIKKLAKDYRQWESIPDSLQRIKFTIATYNAGIGHMYDAQRLAKKYGKNPLVWDDNVEIYIKKLSQPKYYHDSLAYYGYIRGSETYNYVRSIFSYFKEYKDVYDKSPSL